MCLFYQGGKIVSLYLFSLPFIEGGTKNFLFSTGRVKLISLGTLSQSLLSSQSPLLSLLILLYSASTIVLLSSLEISVLLTSHFGELISAKVAMTENT